MKLTIREFRSLIKETLSDCWGGSHPDEMYEQELSDDPALAKHSVLVPDDVKASINKWSKAMGLSSKKKHSRSS